MNTHLDDNAPIEVLGAASETVEFAMVVRALDRLPASSRDLRARRRPAPWRVGYHLDPLGFTPHELYGFQHRFRTLYFAELPEACLREVLTDFRPILAARERHIERGPDQPDRTVGVF